MRTVALHEAKARLSELVASAEAGEVVQITRHGKVVARLVSGRQQPRSPGSASGTVEYTGDFELSEFELDTILDGDVEP